MRNHIHNNRGYSILLALLLIGFMLVLTVGVYQLVMREFQDTKAMEYSLKAFSGAEWAVELALLRAKEHGYTYEAEMKKPDQLASTLFADPAKRIVNKDAEISYTVKGTTEKYDKIKLPKYDFHIIPLFYYDAAGVIQHVRDLKLSDVSGDILWNMIDSENGMTGAGAFDRSTTGWQKNWDGSTTRYTSETIGTYLSWGRKVYLMLQNPTDHEMTYTLSTEGGGKMASDWMKIEGSGEVGGFQQTLQVQIHTSEYLNVLKYVIFWEY